MLASPVMLPEREDLLAALLRTSPSPVVASDREGRIVVFNGAAERVFGYRAAEARDFLHVSDLYHRPGDARRVGQRLRVLAPGVPETFELSLRARNGELVPAFLAASRVEDAGRSFLVGVVTDRRAELALDKRLEDAAGLVVASEQRAASVATLHAAAQDLAAPLTAAMGHLELLLEGPELDDGARRRAERAYAQLERLAHLAAAFTRATRGGSR